MVESFALSDKGCVRTNNEDYCLIEPELGVYVLADGMGGARAGEFASRLAVDTVAENILFAGRRDGEALRSAIEEANRRVIQAASSNPAMEGMGTTVVAALETDGGLAIASVGDSRAYLLDPSGFRLITEDQTWVNEVGRPLGLDEEILRTQPMRHVLTMAVGAGPSVKIKSYFVPIQPPALLLLCSDGLHGVVEQAEIERILRDPECAKLSEKCQVLVEAAKEAGGPDNVTVVLLRVSTFL